MSKFAELPDGTKLEFPDDTEDTIIDSVVKKHLGVSDKRETTFMEDIGIGMGQVAKPIVKAAGLFGGGLATAFGNTDTADKIYQGANDLAKSVEDYWTPTDAEQDFGGKLAGTVATLPMQLLAMPFSPADTGTTFIDKGESLDKARAATLVDTAGNIAGAAIPGSFGSTLGKKMLTGAASNAAQDFATRQIISDIADTEEVKKQFAPTAETTALSAIVGGGMGMLPSGKVPDKSPQLGIGDPYSGRAKPTTEETYSGRPDAERAFEVVNSEIDTLKTKLEEPDISDHYREQILDDLNSKIDKRNRLAAALGEVVEADSVATNTPRTRVEVPTIDELSAVDRQIAEAEQKPSEAFVPKATKGEVYESIIGKDLSNWKSSILEGMLERKQEKIEKAREEAISLGLNTPEGAKAYNFYRMLQEEYEHIKSFLPEAKQLDWHGVDGYIPTWVLGHDMRNALQTSGIRGGLEFLAKHRDNPELHKFGRSLGHLANTLLENPLIKGDPVYDPAMPHSGAFDNVSGNIIFQNKADVSPAVFVHEVIHKAVNKAIGLYNEGKLTDPKQIHAVVAITKLFDTLKRSTDFKGKLVDFVGADKYKIYMENTREFVAYGMSDEKFMMGLDSIKLGNKTAWSKLVDNIKNLLGLDTKARTALDELMGHGEVLIGLSDGQPLGHKPVTGGLYSFSKVHTPESILAGIRAGALNIFAHGFTAQMRQMMRKNPLFTEMAKVIEQAEFKNEFLKREILGGVDSLKDWSKKGKFFFKLSGSEKEGAVVPAMYNMKNTEILDVHDAMMDGYRKGQDHDTTIQQHSTSWNDKQINLAKAIAKASQRLWEESVRTQASIGVNTMKMRAGWMPTQRIGDYYVTVSMNGVPVRVQSFLTEYEANYWKDRISKDDKTVSVEMRNVKDDPNTEMLSEFIERALNDVPAGEVRQHLEDRLQALQEKNANIGNHMMRSSILSGYIGDQFGLSRERCGQLLRDAIPRSLSKYADNIMAREVLGKHVNFLLDKGNKLDKTTEDLIDFYVRSQVGRLVPDKSIRASIGDVSRGIREFIDTAVDKVLGPHGRDKHALDRFFGLFSNVFYTANITMKPTIWIAQPLQALMSARSAFKEGESPLQVMSAVGSTIKQLSIGKLGNDPEFVKALHTASQKSNVLHPQMVNEFNNIRIGTNPNSLINKVIDHGLGHSISAAGDKASRFMSFLFFYNLHKQKGLKGDELALTAARDATENMIAYGNKKLPAIYRETGIFGEQGAPLMTFAHGQLGNMIVDIKEFVQQPTARTAAPLILTAGIMTMLGGAIALPIIAEYELLRQAGISMGWWGAEEWPSPSKIILEKAPTWVSHGVLSDMTGVDMDASMRYSSLMKGVFDIENQSLLAFAPHLKWGVDFIGGAATLGTEATGLVTHTPEQMDKAFKAVVPKGWMTGVVEAARGTFDEPYTRQGSNGQAGVPMGPAEKVSRFLGARSTREAIASQHLINTRAADQAETKQISKLAQLSAAAMKAERNNKPMEAKRYFAAASKPLTALLDSNKDPEELARAIEEQVKSENIPALLRYYAGTSGSLTPDKQRKVVRDNLQYLLKKYNREY